ncbi:MAG: MFS transporter, partial [Nitriliruptorales bacterium]
MIRARVRSVATALRRSDPALRAVLAEGFFTRLGFGIVTFALPLYAIELGMSLTEVGLIAGAKAIVQPAVKPLMGVVVDRFGARRGYLAAVVLRFLASLVLLVATTPVTLVAVRLLQGTASAARDPASITVLARPGRRRLGQTFSLAIGAKDLGNVSAGAVAGGLLAATGGSFTPLWWLVVVLAALSVIAVWSGIPGVGVAAVPVHEGARGSIEMHVSGRFNADGAIRIARDPRLRLVAALGLSAGLTAHMTHGLFQVYAAEIAGLDPGRIGFIYSLSVASLLVLGPLAGAIADRIGTERLATVRGIANAASSLVYAVLPFYGGVLGGRLIDDAGKAAFRPTWGALVGDAARSAGPRGGRVAGSLDAALSLGEAVGPLMAGLIWDIAGVGAFFAVRAILGLSTELVLGRALRRTPAARVDVVTVRDLLQRAWPGEPHEELVRVWYDHGLDRTVGRLSEHLDTPLDALPEGQGHAVERAASARTELGGLPLACSPGGAVRWEAGIWRAPARL